MSAVTSRLRLPGRIPRVRGVGAPSGISAIIVKELRGRMRGRRAFVVLTIHVLLLSVFAWMFQRLNEESISSLASYGGQTTYASASVGRGIFMGLIFVQTLIVSVLAPAATAGAISSEREHQTLELLAVTPISSLAIVLGKLLSALAWVFILILASIPITALVFVFGGVAPDDVVRGYAVLFATVIGLGSIGIFFSALTRRTGASTGLTFVATLALAIGTLFIWVFLSSTAEISATGLRKQPPEAILYLNPFVAQADVICGTEDGGFGGACGFMSGILTPVNTDIVPPDVMPTKPVPGFGGGGIVTDDGVSMPIRKGGVIIDGDVAVTPAIESTRDRFWPKSVISLLVLSLVLTVAAVQLVTPTRRWRPSLPGPVRRLIRRRSAT
jgi:ABC-type transport system involved in multi-copper enzyme maturation permease subunit